MLGNCSVTVSRPDRLKDQADVTLGSLLDDRQWTALDDDLKLWIAYQQPGDQGVMSTHRARDDFRLADKRLGGDLPS
jgi:hypothetical protein